MSPAPRPISNNPEDDVAVRGVEPRRHGDLPETGRDRHEAGRHRELASRQARPNWRHRGADDKHDGDREDAEAGLKR